jgi:hypothetical protein
MTVGEGMCIFFLFVSTTNHCLSEKNKEKNFKTLTPKKKSGKIPKLKMGFVHSINSRNNVVHNIRLSILRW